MPRDNSAEGEEDQRRRDEHGPIPHRVRLGKIVERQPVDKDQKKTCPRHEHDVYHVHIGLQGIRSFWAKASRGEGPAASTGGRLPDRADPLLREKNPLVIQSLPGKNPFYGFLDP